MKKSLKKIDKKLMLKLYDEIHLKLSRRMCNKLSHKIITELRIDLQNDLYSDIGEFHEDIKFQLLKELDNAHDPRFIHVLSSNRIIPNPHFQIGIAGLDVMLN